MISISRLTYVASYAGQDDQIWKMLFRKVYIEMDGPLYVFGCGELIRLILQISTHILYNGIHMVFLPYESSDVP